MAYQQRQVVTLEQRDWLVNQAQQEFNHILSTIETDLNWEKEKAFALQMLMENDYLAQVAANNPVSLKQALLNVASSSLTLNPVLKYAYLVPRDNKIILDVGYLGLIYFATSHNYVQEVQAKIVHQHDHYRNVGFGEKPEHTYEPFGDRGQPVGCSVIARTGQNNFLVEEMTREEIHVSRTRSRAYQAYLKDNRKLCPWVTDELEMWRKTTVKRAFKYWITNKGVSDSLCLDSDVSPAQKLITTEQIQPQVNVIPMLSDVAKNIRIAINDCLNMSELEQMAEHIRDSGIEEHEIARLRVCWANQRNKILKTA